MSGPTNQGLIKLATRLAAAEARAEKAERNLEIAVDALRDIRDNYDCDADAHKYNTTCRSCKAGSTILRVLATKVGSPD